VIAKWVQQLIYNTIDPWVVQEPGMSNRDILQAIIDENNIADNMFVGSKEANTVMMVRRSTPWVADIHLFTDNKDMWKVVAATKKAQDYILNNTVFHKLEMRTSERSMELLARRCGWRKEGMHPQAVATPDGEFIDEVSYGLIKEVM
jgi:hypothetical protein